MKRLALIIALVALTLTACNNQSKEKNNAPKTVTTTIAGRFVGSGIETISLERIADNFGTVEHIANYTLTPNGDFSFALELDGDSSPRYYQIIVDEESYPVTLIVAPGDKITLEAAGDIFYNYRVKGSEESELIRTFTNAYLGEYDKFIALVDSGDSAYAINIATAAIRNQIAFAITNADKLASVYATKLHFFEEHIPMLSSRGISHIHQKTISDALAKSYPTSPYIDMLNRDIEYATMLLTAPESLYPNISLTDINRNTHNLSDYKGKVTLLCFWTSEDSMSNIFVGEFKEIYNRYHDKGLEAYFVSADQSRIRWIEMVQKQQHPWTSVYGGDDPLVFTSYNIQVVPYAFIIDREGTMQYAPLVPKELEALIKKLL